MLIMYTNQLPISFLYLLPQQHQHKWKVMKYLVLQRGREDREERLELFHPRWWPLLPMATKHLKHMPEKLNI